VQSQKKKDDLAMLHSDSSKDEEHDQSKVSGKSSGKSSMTHPEEKNLTKEFMGNLYSSAIGKALSP